MKRTGTRRRMAISLAVIIVVLTLLYVEHPSTHLLKRMGSAMGLSDSQHTIVGMTDIRSIDHIRGDPDANVVLIEYSDLGCVMCAAMQENFEKIVREEDVLLVSRHLYPYTEGYIFERAIASECVAKHGGEQAFFTFIKYLYENQHSLEEDAVPLRDKAAELGVSEEDFKECVANDKSVRERVERDSEEGWKLGARGTPYIVVVYKDKPIGISYANEYTQFLDRVQMLVGRAKMQQ